MIKRRYAIITFFLDGQIRRFARQQKVPINAIAPLFNHPFVMPIIERQAVITNVHMKRYAHVIIMPVQGFALSGRENGEVPG